MACVNENQDIIHYLIKLGATECDFCLDDYHRGVSELPTELIGWRGNHDFMI
jgi:hypothetical protein